MRRWWVVGLFGVLACAGPTQDATTPGPGTATPGTPAGAPTSAPDCPAPRSWYPDDDGDGFGVLVGAVSECNRPAGSWSVVFGDCDDTQVTVFPGALEICDGLDNDCDGPADDGDPDGFSGGQLHYADADLDGFGDNGSAALSCDVPVGRVTSAGDCDDANALVHPGADEWCDGLDGDCDGWIDEDAVDADPWFADLDGDGHGDPGNPMASVCTAPPFGVPTALDCDDTRSSVHPGAVEQCNGLDDDCDGAIDDAVVDAPLWYPDTDGDGYGAGIPTASCSIPAGHVSVGSDCDDSDSAIHPGAAEHCDAVDEDCDGLVDDAAVDAPSWYLDLDLDGHGSPIGALEACDPLPGRVSDGLDCNDADPSVHPGAPEDCSAVDRDCDGDPLTPPPTAGATWYLDADADGYGDPSVTVASCTPVPGYVDNDGDCDDSQGDTSPGAEDVCGDGVDNDCNGTVDDGPGDALWYADGDGDGVGVGPGTLRCAGLPGESSVDGDCDDADPTRYPGNGEFCDGIDSDCDGAEATQKATVYPPVGAPYNTVDVNAGDPGNVALLPLTQGGSLVFCDGTYYVGFDVQAPVDQTISSASGAQRTVLNLGGQQTVRHTGNDGSGVRQPHTLTIEGLTLEDPSTDITSAWGDLVVSSSIIRDGRRVDAVVGTTEILDSVITDTSPTLAVVGSATSAGITVADSTFERISGQVLHTEGTAPIAVSNSVFRDVTDLAISITDGPLLVTDLEVVGAEVGAVRIENGDADVAGLSVYESALAGSDFAGIGQYGTGTVTVDSSHFEANEEVQLWCEGGGSLVVRNTTSTRNGYDHAWLVTGAALQAMDCTVDVDGLESFEDAGGIHTTNSALTVRNSVIDSTYHVAMYASFQPFLVEDTVIRNRGILEPTGDPTMTAYDAVGDFNRVTFEYNRAVSTSFGGTVRLTFGTYVFTDSIFRFNETEDFAALWLDEGDVQLIDTVFHDNVGRYGGAIELEAGTLSCMGTVGNFAGFHNNIANNVGGAVYANPGLFGGPTFTATDCDFGSAVDGTDNFPDDVRWDNGSYWYDDDASFVCSGSVCL